jgi:hypothetical protein
MFYKIELFKITDLIKLSAVNLKAVNLKHRQKVEYTQITIRKLLISLSLL